jgi:branched-chain amino acid transport system permease protein
MDFITTTDRTSIIGITGGMLAVFAIAITLSDLALYGVPGFTFVVLEVAILGLIYGFLVLGLNLQFGYTGIINFG